MNLYLLWQFQLVGPGRDDLDNLVGSNSTVIQVAAWSTGDNVLCVEPHPISFLEYWGRSASSVLSLTVTVLSSKDLGLKVFLDLFERSRCLLGVGFCRDQGGLFVLLEVKLSFRIATIVREEGRDTGRF
jgi:hypothetical protein